MSGPRRTRPRARSSRRPTPRRGSSARIRHWRATDIGSDEWWHQLKLLGVERSGVEWDVEHCPTDPETKQLDPHGLPPAPGAAAKAAVHLLLFQRHPELQYSVLSGINHAWYDANRSVKEWILCQLAEILRGGIKHQVEPVVYLLWVDFFEVPDRARFVFPRLLKLLHWTKWKEILEASGPVPWGVKIEAYREAAEKPAMHPWLAMGLARSFHDVFGSVDAVEARGLYHRIQVADPEVRSVLEEVMSDAVRSRVLAVITVDPTDERWTRWIPAQETEPSFLVLLQLIDRPAIWMKSSELMLDNRVLARIVHYRFPFDPGIRHQTSGTWRDPKEHRDVELFRVHGDLGAARHAIGRTVEARPMGLSLRLDEGA